MVGSKDAKEATRPLHVMWWQPVRVRWCEDEEEVQSITAESLVPGTEAYGRVLSYFKFCRIRQRYGGRIRRNTYTGEVEVLVLVPFGRGPGPVILCSTQITSTTANSTVAARRRRRT